MAKVVFILGAGASADAGVPLMSDFLDRAHDLLQSGKVNESKSSFELLFDAVATLPQVHSKATLDIDNVESVFSAFEMARIIGVFADYDRRKIDALDTAMRTVIATTVEHTMLLPGGDRVSPPPPYYEFASMLYRMIEGHPRHEPSIVTFNYDLAADYALHFVGLQAHYAMGADDAIGGVPLLKLHGSLNWAVCSECGEIVPWRLSKYLARYHWLTADLVAKVRLNVTSNLKSFDHGGHAVARTPLIVPPTWGKTSEHANLTGVWHRAAQELRDAENIFVIGYSLPPSDAFFKYLYALATVGRTRIRRFWVFNPDPAVGERFGELLGQAVQNRFRFFKETFAQAVPRIAAEFPSDL